MTGKMLGLPCDHEDEHADGGRPHNWWMAEHRSAVTVRWRGRCWLRVAVRPGLQDARDHVWFHLDPSTPASVAEDR